MSAIAICNPSIEHGDAVSNDMIAMQRVLLRQGENARLFAMECHVPGLAVFPMEEISKFLKSPHDVIIYHYATGWDYGVKLLRELHCRKVIRFHNVTPPEFFLGIHQGYWNVCYAGRQQLAEVTQSGIDLFLPCSTHSQADLVSAGAEETRCRVVPPFHHCDRLRAVDGDLGLIEQYSDGVVNILMVGRMAPNKNHRALIEAFSFYKRFYNARSRLFIVGGEDRNLDTYVTAVKGMAKATGFERDILFTGKVSDAALKSYYLLSDVFVTASLHEGFCVPLIEAMSLSVPIVAYGATAVPETVGNAGLIWSEYDPELMAVSTDRIVRGESLRTALGERGWKRYWERFRTVRIEAAFLEAMRNLP